MFHSKFQGQLRSADCRLLADEYHLLSLVTLQTRLTMGRNTQDVHNFQNMISHPLRALLLSSNLKGKCYQSKRASTQVAQKDFSFATPIVYYRWLLHITQGKVKVIIHCFCDGGEIMVVNYMQSSRQIV